MALTIDLKNFAEVHPALKVSAVTVAIVGLVVGHFDSFLTPLVLIIMVFPFGKPYAGRTVVFHAEYLEILENNALEWRVAYRDIQHLHLLHGKRWLDLVSSTDRLFISTRQTNEGFPLSMGRYSGRALAQQVIDAIIQRCPQPVQLTRS